MLGGGPGRLGPPPWPCSDDSLLDKTPWLFTNTRLSQPRLQDCSESLAGFPECDTALKQVVIHESLHYSVYDALLFPALRRCVVLRASMVTKLRDAQHTNYCKIIFVKANDKIVELVKSVFFNPFFLQRNKTCTVAIMIYFFSIM